MPLQVFCSEEVCPGRLINGRIDCLKHACPMGGNVAAKERMDALAERVARLPETAKCPKCGWEMLRIEWERMSYMPACPHCGAGIPRNPDWR
jgi:predicted RNA-binding Zn-ribbon protein involved in translation (DUF1610 family)